MSPADRLLLLHLVGLRGLVEADDVAASLAVDRAEVRDRLDALLAEGLLSHRPGRISGYALTDDGQEERRRAVHDELAAAGAEAPMADVYERFLPVNGDLLDVCTRWQIRGDGAEAQPNEHDDPAYDQAVISELLAVHERVEPVLAEAVALLGRFGLHADALGTALDRVLSGDHDYFTKPMFPSYHAGWFELHEDFLVTLGRERHSEGS